MNAGRDEVLTRREPGRRGAHRSRRDHRRRWSRGCRRIARCGPVRTGTVPAAVAMIVIAAAVAGLLAMSGMWPQVSGAVLHHLDTVVATVLLAGSLAVVWRLSDDGR